MVKNSAISKRYTRMLEALDLAIDWIVNPPLLKKEYDNRMYEWTPCWGSVISDACNYVGCSESEMDTLLDYSEPSASADAKLKRLLEHRRELSGEH